MKDSNEVINEFNEIVNMTASELEKWLKSGDSRSAGWPKEDETGESVGHDSGRKIVEILKSNPNKDPEKYTEDQIQHMRKVVSYCKRHLAQEEKANNEKSTEEVKQTKSYASLKNWGHDFLKQKGQKGDEGEEEEEEAEEEDAQDAGGDDNADEEEEEDGGEEEKTAGDKRKKPSADQSGANKKQETAKGKGTTKDGDGEEEDGEEEEEDDDEDNHEEKTNGSKKSNGKQEKNGEGDQGQNGKSQKGPEPGDTVSWNWGGGQPEGKVLDVKEDTAEITTKRGNKVSRHGDPEDPAVILDTGKSKAIKSNHELNES